jgi:hypothetical protein
MSTTIMESASYVKTMIAYTVLLIPTHVLNVSKD